jgi:C4-dicarboxylate transporter, DcuC family
MDVKIVLSLFIIGVVPFALRRRIDARVVLLVASILLFGIMGDMLHLFKKLISEFTKAETVIPLLAALGFAHVIRHTGADTHLVRLLIRPLRWRWAKPLLIPASIGICYWMNMIIVSQTSVAAIVGPLLIPLLQAKGFPAAMIGSTLLLGSSLGGESLNPAASMNATLASLSNTPSTSMTAQIMPYCLLACGLATVIFWLMIRRHQQSDSLAQSDNIDAIADIEDTAKLSILQAIVPIVPILLILASPHVPWFKMFDSPTMTLIAMMIGSLCAALTAPSKAHGTGSKFCEGMGYAFANIITLIAIASTFFEGLKTTGILSVLFGFVAHTPLLALVVGMILAFVIAYISGSGLAAGVGVMTLLVPICASSINPALLGVGIIVASDFGRTASPAAAVVTMCAKLSDTNVEAITKPLKLPILIGLGFLFLLILIVHVFFK